MQHIDEQCCTDCKQSVCICFTTDWYEIVPTHIYIDCGQAMYIEILNDTEWQICLFTQIVKAAMNYKYMYAITIRSIEPVPSVFMRLKHLVTRPKGSFLRTQYKGFHCKSSRLKNKILNLEKKILFKYSGFFNSILKKRYKRGSILKINQVFTTAVAKLPRSRLYVSAF